MNKLLMEITKLDFVTVDLQEYIDTHPTNQEAIALYNKTVKEAKALRDEYEKMCGPLTNFRCESRADSFTWINEPWPWEKEFYN